MTQPGGTTRQENAVAQTILRVHPGGSRGAPGRARRVQRFGRTTGGTDASEVSHWNQVAATTLIAFPGPNGGAPPAFQINMGMVQGAVYDAVNAIGQEAASAISAQEACGCEGVDRRCRRNGGIRRALRARLDRTRESSVPGSCGTPDDARHGVRGIARCDRRRRLQEPGHRDRARGGQGHARREGGRRTVRAVPVGAEHRRRTLAAAHQSRPGADPRSDPVGGRREAVPHPELVAVPQRAAARARQRAVGGRVQRGQEPRQSRQLDPDRRRRRTSPGGGRAHPV